MQELHGVLFSAKSTRAVMSQADSLKHHNTKLIDSCFLCDYLDTLYLKYLC